MWMMVKSAPASSFLMTEPEFLLEFFVVALDDPTMLGQAHQVSNFGLRSQLGEPVFGGSGSELGQDFHRWFKSTE